jgi:hypothetical protein
MLLLPACGLTANQAAVAGYCWHNYSPDIG